MQNNIRNTLSATPSILRGLIEAAPPAAIEFQEAPGTWTPRQVLCHVADGEVTDWMPRVELIISPGDAKTFVPYDREGGFTRYAGWTVHDLLAELDRLRTANLARLATLDLGEADLMRTGIHPDLGVVTLAQLLACWATHDLAHVAQITRTVVRFMGPQVGPWRKYFSLLSGSGD
jgi:hypothetical protein